MGYLVFAGPQHAIAVSPVSSPEPFAVDHDTSVRKALAKNLHQGKSKRTDVRLR